MKNKSEGYKARIELLNMLADRWLDLCMRAKTVQDMREARMLVGAVCQIENTLKALRFEDRGLELDTGTAGSAVRKYSAEFASGGVGGTSRRGPALVEFGDPGDDGSDPDDSGAA
jgi:hypothetical protein